MYFICTLLFPAALRQHQTRASNNTVEFVNVKRAPIYAGPGRTRQVSRITNYVLIRVT